MQGAAIAMGVFERPDGWGARIVKVHGACKSCHLDFQQRVLELEAARAANDGIDGKLVTQERSYGILCDEGFGGSFQAFKNHVRKHVETYKAARPKPGRAVAVLGGDALGEPDQVKVERFRAGIEAIVTDEKPRDVRGVQVDFLETIVGISLERAKAFPEQVTVQDGLRAAGELQKMRQNSEREELIKMVGAAIGHTVGSVVKRGLERETSGAVDRLPVIDLEVDGAVEGDAGEARPAGAGAEGARGAGGDGADDDLLAVGVRVSGAGVPGGDPGDA